MRSLDPERHHRFLGLLAGVGVSAGACAWWRCLEEKGRVYRIYIRVRTKTTTFFVIFVYGTVQY